MALVCDSGELARLYLLDRSCRGFIYMAGNYCPFSVIPQLW